MSLTALEFVVVTLAAYRATRLLTKDGIFEVARDRVEMWSAAHEADGHRVRGSVQELVTCPYCMSFWTSAAAYAVAVFALGRYGRSGLWAHFIAAWGVMGGSALLGAVDGWLEQTSKAATEVAEDG